MGKEEKTWGPLLTFVMPNTPILGLEEVDPFPVPRIPARMQLSPSTKIPL